MTKPGKDRANPLNIAKRDERDAIETEVSDPEIASNADKHEVAARILKKGADGHKPDPKEEGVDQLPDRIIDRG